MLTITMMRCHLTLLVPAIISLHDVIAAPVQPSLSNLSKTSAQQRGKASMDAGARLRGKGASVFVNGKAFKERRNPLPSERKVLYKPRTTPRFLTGTPRQQVEQMRYKLPPKGPNETEEEFQARKGKKVRDLEYRKRAFLRKIEELEAQYGGQGEEAVIKQFDEWMKHKQLQRNFGRTKKALGREDLTLEDYESLRRQKQQEDDVVTASWKLSHQEKKLAQHKHIIRRKLKQGDEQSILWAKERMDKYGISMDDLNDGRRIGQRKASIRRTLNRYPDNEVAMQEAIKFGMDPKMQAASRTKASYQEYDASKRRKIAAVKDQTFNAQIAHEQGQASSDVQRSQHCTSSSHCGILGSTSPPGFQLGPASLASAYHKEAPSSSAKKAVLPFDLNAEPPLDDK